MMKGRGKRVMVKKVVGNVSEGRDEKASSKAKVVIGKGMVRDPDQHSSSYIEHDVL